MKINFTNRIIILFAILATTSGVMANDLKPVGSSNAENFQKVGAAGGQFLKIGVGGRGTSMGGAQAAITEDVSSIFWNPAGLADLKSLSVMIAYTSWMAGYDHNYAAFATPINDQFVIGVHALSFGASNIPITTISRPEGTGASYSINDYSFGASISGYLTDQFSFGVTAKYIQNAFASVSAGGLAFDIGTKYKTGLEGITLGFSIHNLGGQQEYAGEDLNSSKKIVNEFPIAPIDVQYLSYPFNLPLIFRAGLGMEAYNDEDQVLNIAADFVTLSDTPEQYALGAEYIWNDILIVRGGYVFGHDQLGASGGIGLKYFSSGFDGQFEYSVNPTTSLGLVNRIALKLSFGS